MEIPSPDELNARKRDDGVGPLVGIIIVIALMAAGGIYYLVRQEMQRQANPPAGQEQAHS